jgi:hypothetical protein
MSELGAKETTRIALAHAETAQMMEAEKAGGFRYLQRSIR